MLNSITYSLPEGLAGDLATEINRFNTENIIARIWAKDAAVWTGDDEDRWLGWLEIVGEELAEIKKYNDLQSDIWSSDFENILLMGMGGSSLGPEVMALTFGETTFHILDSTVPAQVKAVEDRLDLEKTLFIVASKSGSTLEPNCFKQYFFERVAEKVGRSAAGRQFIAITDPGSKMEKVAKDDRFRHIFYGKPEIGGRFSVLSAFGMTAAAAMSADVEEILTFASEMVVACRDTDPAENPGALLGMILGLCHARGRDKLTIFTSSDVHDLGAWLEQLIAESTGKNGVAVIPVDREPAIETANYSNDRVFVFLGPTDEAGLNDQYDEVSAAGFPAVRIGIDDIGYLGQEFFRWEFATAVAGSVMKINPFNQPDVESAKIEARKITDEYERTGKLPDETPVFTADGISIFTTDQYADELFAAAREKTVTAILNEHLSRIGPGDYFGLLGYIEMNEENETALQSIRRSILDRHNCATCLGFGPRFLHSTGQAYKGGANNGVFLQITSDDDVDLPVPGQTYTFGVVKAAQSRGDFQVLLDRGRRALRVHLGKDVAVGLGELAAMI